MALSAWDLIAFDTDGNVCNGIFIKGNTKVEIYKNWIYVSNKKMWQKESLFIEPVIAEVVSGELIISNVHIFSERNRKQHSIFMICYSGYKRDYKIMVGIGCYGYKKKKYIGVQKETYEAFLKFLDRCIKEDHVNKKYVDKIKKMEPMRFNQGDYYFSKHLKTDLPISKIGEIEKPMIEKM